MSKIVIVDQDDTLWNFLDVHIASYERMFPQVYGVTHQFISGPGVGGTTRTYISNVLRQQGFSDKDITDKIQQAEEFMAEVFREELRNVNGSQGVFPGAREFLELARRNNLVTIVGTGTSRVISQEILRFTGLSVYFQTGAYGCEGQDRNEVFRLALKKSKMLVEEINGVYVLDDSIKGIEAARFIEARSIALRSGHQKDELEQHNPDIIFESVKEYQRIIEYIMSK